MDHPPPHRFDQSQKDDAILDQGTFVWEVDGATLAFEHFTMLRTSERGFWKKKRTGLRLFTSVTSPDGSLDLESRWDYDARLYPTSLEMINRTKALERGQDRRAVFSLKAPNAQLKMGPKSNLTTLNVGYESGWLVAIEPSVMPYAIMLGRYDMKGQGRQSFTLLRTSAMDDFFTLTKIHLSLAFMRTFEVSVPKGKRTQIHYFSGKEQVMERGQGKTPAPHRQVHLWSDGEQRLRKVLVTTGAQDVIATRQGDEDLAPLLRLRQGSEIA